MIHRPTTVPSHNTRSIAHVIPEQVRDIDRLEDLLADAIGAAREAVSMLDEISYDDIKPVDRWRRKIAIQVEHRRILNEDFAFAVQKLLHHLDSFPPEDPDLDNTPIRSLRRALNRSLYRSQRVADLLAAEDELASQRGIGC